MIRSNLNPTLGNGEFNNLLVKLYKLEQKKNETPDKITLPPKKIFKFHTTYHYGDTDW